MIVRDINISDIKIVENVRVKIDKLEGLMQDIRQNGLDNPIKVSKIKSSDYILVQGNRRLMACKKLGWKKIPASISEDMDLAELLSRNMAENIHREDISPLELGRICHRLKTELGLSIGEIHSKLSIPISRINAAISSFNGMPTKHRNSVTFSAGARTRTGNIPATVALRIIAAKRNFGLSDAGVEKLLNVAKVEEYGQAELAIIDKFLSEGLTVTQAIEAAKEYQYMRTDIIVHKAELESLMKKYKMDSKALFMNAVLYGEIPPLKRPSWFKSKQVPVKE